MCDARRDENDLLDYKDLYSRIRVKIKLLNSVRKLFFFLSWDNHRKQDSI